LEPDLKRVTAKDDSMPAAFVTLAEAGLSLRDASPTEKVNYYSRLASKNNSYLQVEAAKMVAKIDWNAGKILLGRFAEEKGSGAYVSANNWLRAMQVADGEAAVRPLPPSDELYETVLSVIGETTPPPRPK